MRKALAYSALGVTAWLALGITWTVVSMATGLPGPARTVAASIEGTARVIEAPHLPAPLDGARAALTRQLRLGGRLVERIYRTPQRIASRLLRDEEVERVIIAPALAPHPPVAPEAPAIPRVSGMDAAVEARIEAHRERIEARVEERLERARTRIERRVERGEASERTRRRLLENLETLGLQADLELGELVAEALSMAAAELDGAEVDVDGTRIRLVLPGIRAR